jgi:hypothetical protein
MTGFPAQTAFFVCIGCGCTTAGTWIDGTGPYCLRCAHAARYRQAIHDGPFVCPLCHGSGLVGVAPAERSLHPTAPICPACWGTGIVWRP